MQECLAQVVAFAAAAISEALARRGVDDTYSPTREIDRIVRALTVAEVGPVGIDPDGAAARVRAALDDGLAPTPSAPLARVEATFAGDRVLRDVLRLVLAWHVEPRIGVLFGHVHDALQRTRPTVGAIAEILRASAAVVAALGGRTRGGAQGVIAV